MMDGVFLVLLPTCRIVCNILSKAVQGGVIPDDVFVIIALPNQRAGGAM